MCLVVTCWERADLLALVCGVQLWVCYFPNGILGQVWYLIVSIPDLFILTYFISLRQELSLFLSIISMSYVFFYAFVYTHAPYIIDTFYFIWSVLTPNLYNIPNL